MSSHHNELIEKPVVHLSLADWQRHMRRLIETGDALRQDAFEYRQDCLRMRNNATSDIRAATSDNNDLLKHRIDELNRWRSLIVNLDAKICNQMRRLDVEKRACDDAVLQLQKPIGLLLEFFTRRDCRLGSELTYDDADAEIRLELQVLETNLKELQNLSQRAWKKLVHLQEVKFWIDLEVNNKQEAVQMDTDILAMDGGSTDITYKLKGTKDPKNSISYEEWLEHTRNMVIMAKNELADSYAIGDAMSMGRYKSRILLIGQQQRTDFSIRKRIFDTQRACNDLQFQLDKIQRELHSAQCELESLSESYSGIEDATKLVQTRLVKRSQRSGLELCRDAAHLALCSEDRKLREARLSLATRIDVARAKTNNLGKHAERIITDLANKKQSLETDTRAMELRDQLRSLESADPAKSSQTDRNIELLQLEEQRPKVSSVDCQQ